MKKTLIAMMALSILSVSAAQAATQTNSVSKWLDNASKKVEQKENAAYSKAAANKKAAEARQKERQQAVEQQKKAIEKRGG